MCDNRDLSPLILKMRDESGRAQTLLSSWPQGYNLQASQASSGVFLADRMVWRMEGLARKPKTRILAPVPSPAGCVFSGKSIESLGVSVSPHL